MIRLVPVFILMLASYANATDYNDLIHAIHMAEGSGKATAPAGDGGKAIGPFQIHRIYWADAVAYDPKIGGTYNDCNSYEYSLKIVNAYLHKYGSKFIKDGNWEALARIHNGGPKGWVDNDSDKSRNTKKYWLDRVKPKL